jgi:hypothetical protein
MEHEQVATDLLGPIWRGLDAEYKRKYARSIWDQFEANVRSAAYTSKLSTWYDGLSRKLTFMIRKDDAPLVEAALRNGGDRRILKALREETALLVLMVRVANEERKEQAKAEAERLF